MPLKDLITSSFPQYCETLVSGKSVCFRPMIVLEEKSLLLVKDSDDKTGVLKTLMNIINSCFDGFIAKESSIADFEHAFLLLRAKSLGEIESFSIKCPDTDEDAILKINILNDIKINKPKSSPKIKINNNLLLIMTPPTIKTLIQYPDYNTNSDKIYSYVASCLKQIQTQKEIINCEDKPEKEIVEFIQNLTPQQFNMIIEYFDSLPSIQISSNYKTSDGVTRQINIKGLFNFINFFFDHLTLDLYYRQNFQMKYHHHYSLDEIETMIPWERTVYLEQIRNHLKQETNRLNNTTEMSF